MVAHTATLLVSDHPICGFAAESPLCKDGIRSLTLDQKQFADYQFNTAPSRTIRPCNMLPGCLYVAPGAVL